MLRLALFAAVSFATCMCCFGQTDLLSLMEARQIVSLVPEVVASRQRGECPAISAADSLEERVFFVEVRGVCPPPGFAGSMLVNNYVVDRSTGTVRIGIDTSAHKLVGSTEVAALARSLADGARSRVLSLSDAQCVAFEAGIDSLSKGPEGGSVTVTPVGVLEQGLFQFLVTLHNDAGNFIQYLTVDSRHLIVREDGASFDISSPGVAGLLARLKDMQSPPELTGAMTVAVAAAVVMGEQGFERKCFEFYADADEGLGREQYVEIRGRCAGQTYPHSVLAVDVLTGQIRDARTASPIRSPKAQDVAQSFFKQILDSRTRAQTEIGEICQAISSAH